MFIWFEFAISVFQVVIPISFLGVIPEFRVVILANAGIRIFAVILANAGIHIFAVILANAGIQRC
jgi:hypothetical protein